MKQPLHLHNGLLTHRLRTTTLKGNGNICSSCKRPASPSSLIPNNNHPQPSRPHLHSQKHPLLCCSCFVQTTFAPPGIHLYFVQIHDCTPWKTLVICLDPRLHALKYTCVLSRPRLRALEYTRVAFKVLSPKSQKNPFPTMEDTTHHCSPHYTQHPCILSPPTVG